VRPIRSRAGTRIPRGTFSARSLASPELTLVAAALTSTSPSPGVGVGTSWICTTSGGPYAVQTAAFTHHLARALRERTAPALQIDLLGVSLT
jgi:hypothetical protein